MGCDGMVRDRKKCLMDKAVYSGKLSSVLTEIVRGRLIYDFHRYFDFHKYNY